MIRWSDRRRWTEGVARLRCDLAQIAVGPEGVQQRADAVLDLLARDFHFEGAVLDLRNPEERRRVPLATAGDADALRLCILRADADHGSERFGLLRPRPPLRACELAVPLPEVSFWGEHLLPAGFQTGLSAALFTTAGRHVGGLSLVAADASRLSRAEADAIGAVADVMADVLDRGREIAEAARLVVGACAGALLTRGGDTVPLPGMPTHPQLAPQSVAATVSAAELATGTGYVTFLVPEDVTDGGPLVRVTAIACARPELDHLVAALLVGPPGNCHGLSVLALRVLGLVAEGVTQVPALAAALHTRPGPVRHALQAAQHALGTEDLAALGVRAIGAGLRIPSATARPGGTSHDEGVRRLRLVPPAR